MIQNDIHKSRAIGAPKVLNNQPSEAVETPRLIDGSQALTQEKNDDVVNALFLDLRKSYRVVPSNLEPKGLTLEDRHESQSLRDCHVILDVEDSQVMEVA